jgi:hypothetical protein
MRKWLWGGLVLVTLLVAYWGFALFGASQVAAAASGNTDVLMQKIDLPALRHSLAHQIVQAYLRQNSKTEHLTGLAGNLAGALGGTVADAMLQDVLTPQNLASLLKQGQLSRGTKTTTTIQMPPLGDVFKGSILQALTSAHFDGPFDFVVDLGHGDDLYGVHLHLESFDWRVAGLDLPPTLTDQLAQEVAANQQKTD